MYDILYHTYMHIFMQNTYFHMYFNHKPLLQATDFVLDNCYGYVQR